MRGAVSQKYLGGSVADNAAASERGNLSASTMRSDILTIIYGALWNTSTVLLREQLNIVYYTRWRRINFVACKIWPILNLHDIIFWFPITICCKKCNGFDLFLFHTNCTLRHCSSTERKKKLFLAGTVTQV